MAGREVPFGPLGARPPARGPGGAAAPRPGHLAKREGYGCGGPHRPPVPAAQAQQGNGDPPLGAHTHGTRLPQARAAVAEGSLSGGQALCRTKSAGGAMLAPAGAGDGAPLLGPLPGLWHGGRPAGARARGPHGPATYPCDKERVQAWREWLTEA